MLLFTIIVSLIFNCEYLLLSEQTHVINALLLLLFNICDYNCHASLFKGFQYHKGVYSTPLGPLNPSMIISSFFVTKKLPYVVTRDVRQSVRPSVRLSVRRL